MRVLAWGATTLSLSLLILIPASNAQPAPERRGEIVIGSNGPSAPTVGSNCVEVEIGGDKSGPMECLNRQLKRQVDRAMPSIALPPIDAASQDIRVGVFNRSAVQQQYGSNFGVSVIPQRPPVPSFTNSLGGRR